jgi:hypothetical protein
MCFADLLYYMRALNPGKYKDMGIQQFADLLCAGLTPQDRQVEAALDGDAIPLVQITNEDGERATKRRSLDGVNDYPTLSAQQGCWQCRQCYDQAVSTSFCCPQCSQPLCKLDRSPQDPNRSSSCYSEHRADTNPNTECQRPRRKQYRPPPGHTKLRKPPWVA